MTTQTPNYNLTLYDNLSPDKDATFQTYRNSQSGVASDSNMNIIDLALSAHDVSIANKVNGFTYIYANATGTNTYEKNSITSITSYDTGMGILLSVDTPNSGSSTLNINALGARVLKKLNTSGSSVSLVAGDLLLGVIYPFIYYSGDMWVLLAGGATGTTSGSGATFTSGSVTSGHIAIFDGSSGSLIKDGGAPAGGGVTLEELDGTPSVAVSKIKVNNGTVTDNGGGVATLDCAAATDGAAIHDDTASEISAITEKTTPVAADMLIIEDSADSNNKKMVKAGNLPFVARNGSTTDAHLMVWDGSNANSAKDGGVVPVGIGTPASATVTNSNITTTSGSYVAISSSLDVTITIGASGRAYVFGYLNLKMTALADCFLAVGVDSSTPSGIFHGAHAFDVTQRMAVPFAAFFTGLSVGSHTFKIYWYVTGGNTVTLEGSSRGGAQQGSHMFAIPI